MSFLVTKIVSRVFRENLPCVPWPGKKKKKKQLKRAVLFRMASEYVLAQWTEDDQW